MKTLRLKFADDGFGIDKTVEFEASDEAGALALLERHADGRWVQLIRDGKVLCQVGREKQIGLFTIMPASVQIAYRDIGCEP